MIHNYAEDDDFYMFYYKTEFCPFNLTEHDKSKCVYAHNWQDYRRKPDLYPYEPLVKLTISSLASTGRPKITYTITRVHATADLPATCAMAGRNSNIILHTTRQYAVRPTDAKKDRVQTTTPLKKKELLTLRCFHAPSATSLKIE